MSSIATKYISCKEVLAKIYSDLNLGSEYRLTDMIEWIGEAMEHMDATVVHQDKVVDLTIKEFRAKLPCDLYLVDTVQHNQFAMIYDMTKGATSYHTTNAETTIKNLYSKPENTYTIQFPFLNTYFRDGDVRLFYKAFPVDEEGLPMIPDNIYFKEACLYYVMFKLKTADYNTGKINFNEWQAIKQMFNKTADKAMTAVSFPHPDKVKSMMNRWMRLVPIVNEHEYMNYFSNFQQKI